MWIRVSASPGSRNPNPFGEEDQGSTLPDSIQGQVIDPFGEEDQD
jgi:hypothetical protein